MHGCNTITPTHTHNVFALQAIISLKKAERVVSELDSKIESSKTSIKHFGSQADDIADGIKRSEEEHKRELSELHLKLDELRKGLVEQQQVLQELVVKRGKITNTVQRWKEHVASLRDAHDAASQPPDAEKVPRDPMDVPEPPSTLNVLSDIGLAPAPFASPHLDAVVVEGDENHLGELQLECLAV